MRNHHLARSFAGCLRGDPLQARSQFGRAVVVEEDENCTAIGLVQRDADRPAQLRLMYKLVARSANGPAYSDLPSPRFSDQSSEENRYGFNLTMALDNGLDLHAKS